MTFASLAIRRFFVLSFLDGGTEKSVGLRSFGFFFFGIKRAILTHHFRLWEAFVFRFFFFSRCVLTHDKQIDDENYC